MTTEEKKAFNSQLWHFLWASILIALSTCLGSVVDAMIVDNLINEDAVSAINLSLPFLLFMYTVNMLLATGDGIDTGGYQYAVHPVDDRPCRLAHCDGAEPV